MKATSFFDDHSTMYPGQYELLDWKEQEIKDECRHMHERFINMQIEVKEMSDRYSIEIAAPGFSREDFVIITNGQILSIVALKSPAVRDEYPFNYIPGTEPKFIKEDIQLPKGVDTDFGTAEFKNGLLSIQFYKTDYPVESRQHPIIVY